MKILEVPEKYAALRTLHREDHSLLKRQVLQETFGNNMVLQLTRQPRLKLYTRNLLALAVEVGQVLSLFYCVRDLC